MLLLGASRSLWLAPFPVGWVMYLANVVLETVHKRSRVGRAGFETILATTGCALIGLASGMWALGVACAYLGLVVENLLRERRMVQSVIGIQETLGLRRGRASDRRFPAPCLHPALAVRVDGPFVRRMPCLDLGIVQANQPLAVRVMVGNHSRVPLQGPATIRITAGAGWSVQGIAEASTPRLRSGEVASQSFVVLPVRCDGGNVLRIEVSAGRWSEIVVVRCDGCRCIEPAHIAEAWIERYPGGRRSAFALRGDFDLYDEASMQSIDGLKDAFGLTSRFAMPQTMYLSTRLSLDAPAAEAWAHHYGVNRGADAIPTFIRWMRENVDLRHEAPYPVESTRPFVVEIGNHGHLHYDTDASGDPGNGWRAGAKPGTGRYAWQGDDVTSLGDQRDNILEARRWTERELAFTPRSWAKPGRGNDRFSPAAVEAAGCEVASGSDIGPQDNVLRQSPPHHPSTTRIVELTARYPSDPQHVQHAAMLRFWIHRGHRLARPVVVLVHQHMRQFDGITCARVTEWLLDLVVRGFQGDFHIDTVYGIGRYWLDALSPNTRVLHVVANDGGIDVRNESDRMIRDVPIEMRLRDGSRLARIVDLPPGLTRIVP